MKACWWSPVLAARHWRASNRGIEAIDVPLTQTLFAEPVAIGRFERFEAIDQGAVLHHSNNPDGYVYSEQNLTQLAAFAKRHDLWVFADEVYSDFVYEGKHRSIASLEGMAERTITCSSMSKSHGMSGARIGSIAASAAFIGAARRISNHTVYNVPVAMQQAALAALDDGGTWLEEARERYLEARDGASRSLQRHGFKAHLPQGGSFFFVDMADQLADHSVGQLLGHAIERGVLRLETPWTRLKSTSGCASPEPTALASRRESKDCQRGRELAMMRWLGQALTDAPSPGWWSHS